MKHFFSLRHDQPLCNHVFFLEAGFWLDGMQVPWRVVYFRPWLVAPNGGGWNAWGSGMVNSLPNVWQKANGNRTYQSFCIVFV